MTSSQTTSALAWRGRGSRRSGAWAPHLWIARRARERRPTGSIGAGRHAHAGPTGDRGVRLRASRACGRVARLDARRPCATTWPTACATIALDQPDTRNALSDELLRRPHRRLRGRARRRRGALRRARLHARAHVQLGRQPRRLRRRRPARAQAPAPPSASRGCSRCIGELGKPVDLRRSTATAWRARSGSRSPATSSSPSEAATLRHARDQRRRLPLHDHGADLPQRPAQEGDASCCCSASASTPTRRERLGIVNRVVRRRGARRRRGRLGAAARRASRRCS